MKKIQIWLGHSNFSTTANIYAHIDVSAQMETGDIAGAFYVKPEKKPREQVGVPVDSDAEHELNSNSQTEEVMNPKPCCKLKSRDKSCKSGSISQTGKQKANAVCTAKTAVETCTEKTSAVRRSPKKGTAKCRKPKTPQTV
ncbi:hypothetical protein D7X33_08925 [Butyricicoccus sp. 1XD8-22]|nr:hypothetical protein D7X33_08925 [Butyricicoccus sp. 1XD8-22]